MKEKMKFKKRKTSKNEKKQKNKLRKTQKAQNKMAEVDANAAVFTINVN